VIENPGLAASDPASDPLLDVELPPLLEAELPLLELTLLPLEAELPALVEPELLPPLLRDAEASPCTVPSWLPASSAPAPLSPLKLAQLMTAAARNAVTTPASAPCTHRNPFAKTSIDVASLAHLCGVAALTGRRRGPGSR
jgi:hypothetical protein